MQTPCSARGPIVRAVQAPSLPPSPDAQRGTGCTCRRTGWPKLVIDVNCPVESESDYGALGYLVGQQIGKAIPCFRGLDVAPFGQTVPAHTETNLRALGAAMAASGAVALYHVEGVTPESRRGDVVREDAHVLRIESLQAGYSALNTTPLAEVDLVSVGCPHASRDEILDIAERLRGKRVATRLWVTTARATKEAVPEAVELIEQAGGLVVADTCLVVAPIESLGIRRLATNSAKAAFYTPGHSHVNVRFGTLAQCLETAVSGRWPGSESTVR